MNFQRSIRKICLSCLMIALPLQVGAATATQQASQWRPQAAALPQPPVAMPRPPAPPLYSAPRFRPLAQGAAWQGAQAGAPSPARGGFMPVAQGYQAQRPPAFARQYAWRPISPPLVVSRPQRPMAPPAPVWPGYPPAPVAPRLGMAPPWAPMPMYGAYPPPPPPPPVYYRPLPPPPPPWLPVTGLPWGYGAGTPWGAVPYPPLYGGLPAWAPTPFPTGGYRAPRYRRGPLGRQSYRGLLGERGWGGFPGFGGFPAFGVPWGGTGGWPWGGGSWMPSPGGFLPGSGFGIPMAGMMPGTGDCFWCGS